MRARAKVVPLGDGSFRLQCQAYMVAHYGDDFFEEEKRLTNLRGAPFQRLLNEVAKRLREQAAESAATRRSDYTGWGTAA